MSGNATTVLDPATTPVLRWRRELARAWRRKVHEVSPKFRSMAPALLRARIEEAIDAIAYSAAGDDDPADLFLAGLDIIVEQEQLSVQEVIGGLLAAFDALDETIPSNERYSPEMIAAERAIRALIARFAESAVSIATERLEIEAAAQRESSAKLVALQRVGAAVTSSLDLDSTLETIVHEAAELMNGATARLRLVDEEGNNLTLIASAGELGDELRGTSVPIESTLAGLCFRSGRPVISNDVASDPRASREVQEVTRTRSLLSVPLLSQGVSIGVLSMTNQSTRPFNNGDAELLSLFADQAAIAIENGRLYQQAQSQITQMEILNRVSSVVSASLDLGSVYRAIHQEIAKIMVADAFLIFLRNDSDGFDLAYVVDLGQRYAPRHDVTIPNVYRNAMEQRRTFIIDASSHPDFANWERYGDMTRRVQSLVVAPLTRGAESIGIVSAQSYAPSAYRQRDADLLATVANVAAVAIENARLYDQAHGLAVAEERNRLAREIHDTIAQGLVGIILQLEAVSAMIGDEPRLRRRIERAIDLARVNLDEARRSVRDLRAAPLEHMSFAEALHELAEQHEQECETTVSVCVPDTMPLLEQNVELTAFRFVQEALSNCRKHAREASLWIDVALDDRVVVTVRDNGPGFDVDAWRRTAPLHHFGLHGMRERAERLGGDLVIVSERQVGTTLTMTLPLDDAIS